MTKDTGVIRPAAGGDIAVPSAFAASPSGGTGGFVFGRRTNSGEALPPGMQFTCCHTLTQPRICVSFSVPVIVVASTTISSCSASQ